MARTRKTTIQVRTISLTNLKKPMAHNAILGYSSTQLSNHSFRPYYNRKGIQNCAGRIQPEHQQAVYRPGMFSFIKGYQKALTQNLEQYHIAKIVNKVKKKSSAADVHIDTYSKKNHFSPIARHEQVFQRFITFEQIDPSLYKKIKHTSEDWKFNHSSIISMKHTV